MSDTAVADAAASPAQWPYALAVLLLAAGLWLMLPRGQSGGRWLGAGLAAAGLGLLTMLVHFGLAFLRDGAERITFTTPLPALGDWSADVIFLSLAAVTVGSAIGAVTCRSPVYCAIWFRADVGRHGRLAALSGCAVHWRVDHRRVRGRYPGHILIRTHARAARRSRLLRSRELGSSTVGMHRRRDGWLDDDDACRVVAIAPRCRRRTSASHVARCQGRSRSRCRHSQQRACRDARRAVVQLASRGGRVGRHIADGRARRRDRHRRTYTRLTLAIIDAFVDRRQSRRAGAGVEICMKFICCTTT